MDIDVADKGICEHYRLDSTRFLLAAGVASALIVSPGVDSTAKDSSIFGSYGTARSPFFRFVDDAPYVIDGPSPILHWQTSKESEYKKPSDHQINVTSFLMPSSVLMSATDHLAIIDIVRDEGLGCAAARLEDLYELEGDEDDGPMSLRSLRYLATFLIDQGRPDWDRITMGYDGLLGLEWLTESGAMATIFYDNNQVEYAIAFKPELSLEGQLGRTSVYGLVKITKSFLSRSA